MTPEDKYLWENRQELVNVHGQQRYDQGLEDCIQTIQRIQEKRKDISYEKLLLDFILYISKQDFEFPEQRGFQIVFFKLACVKLKYNL